MGAFYDQVYLVPVARATKSNDRLAPRLRLEELEFGDVGRSKRFLPGWYVLPALACGLVLASGIFFL